MRHIAIALLAVAAVAAAEPATKPAPAAQPPAVKPAVKPAATPAATTPAVTPAEPRGLTPRDLLAGDVIVCTLNMGVALLPGGTAPVTMTVRGVERASVAKTMICPGLSIAALATIAGGDYMDIQPHTIVCQSAAGAATQHAVQMVTLTGESIVGPVRGTWNFRVPDAVPAALAASQNLDASIKAAYQQRVLDSIAPTVSLAAQTEVRFLVVTPETPPYINP